MTGYDQSAKTDYGKERITLVPTGIIHAIAKVRMFAVDRKYKDINNWKNVEPVRYRDALCRHLLAYLEDPDGTDQESGLPILYHIATNAAFLIELENNGGKDGGVKYPMTCSRCPVKDLNAYWCSWHDRECRYYREENDEKGNTPVRLRDEVCRVDSEEHRILS